MDEAKFAEAVQFAEQYREGASGDWPKRQADRYPPFPAGLRPMMLSLWIANSAKSRPYWDAVSLIAQQHLRNGEPLPDVLRQWLADVLADPRNGPKRPPGRYAPGEKQVRNGTLVEVIQMLVGKGLTATRTRAKGEEACAGGGSACDAVGVAFELRYDAVRTVWETFRKKPTRAESEWLGLNIPCPERIRLAGDSSTNTG